MSLTQYLEDYSTSLELKREEKGFLSCPGMKEKGVYIVVVEKI